MNIPKELHAKETRLSSPLPNGPKPKKKKVHRDKIDPTMPTLGGHTQWEKWGGSYYPVGSTGLTECPPRDFVANNLRIAEGDWISKATQRVAEK
jgi:hypothetical protein